MNERLRKITSSAVLAALICVLTMFPQIYMPVTKGYVNLGDCLVLTAAWLLGANYGGIAAALGSALADIITGYVHYAPATFIIKGAMAVAAAIIVKALADHETVGRLIGAVVAELIMVAGYFLYSWFFITGSAITSAPSIIGNLVQGVVGIAVGMALIFALDKTKIRKLISTK